MSENLNEKLTRELKSDDDDALHRNSVGTILATMYPPEPILNYVRKQFPNKDVGYMVIPFVNSEDNIPNSNVKKPILADKMFMYDVRSQLSSNKNEWGVYDRLMVEGASRSEFPVTELFDYLDKLAFENPELKAYLRKTNFVDDIVSTITQESIRTRNYNLDVAQVLENRLVSHDATVSAVNSGILYNKMLELK